MKTTKYALVGALVLIALFSTKEARADIVSEVCPTVSVAGSGQLPSIACPTFTGSGLQGIQLHVNDSFSVASITVFGGQTDQTTTVTVNVPFTYTPPQGFGTGTGTTFDMTGTVTVPAGVFTTFTNPSTTNFTGTFDTSLQALNLLPLFQTLTPSSFAVSVSTSAPFLQCTNPAVICSGTFPPPFTQSPGATIAGATAGATVTYTFAPVPEPSSLVLLGIGLLSIVGAVRRKRLA